MKYVIVCYTSDIDIKTNTAKIKYAHFAKAELNNHIQVLDDWVDDVLDATAFHSRKAADDVAYEFMHMTSDSADFSKPSAVSYGIAE